MTKSKSLKSNLKNALLYASGTAVISAAALMPAHALELKAGDTKSGGQHVMIEDITAKLEIRTANIDEVMLSVSGSFDGVAGLADNAAYDVRYDGDTMVIYGPEKDLSKNWQGKAKTPSFYDTHWRERNKKDAFEKYMADFPTLTITVPQKSNVTMDEVEGLIDQIGPLGHVDIDHTLYVKGSFDDADHVDVSLKGAGKLTFGDVAEMLAARIQGSGDLDFDDVGEAALSIQGSGDLNVKFVQNDTKASVQGSGDIRLGDIGGDATFSVQGSGDVKAQKVSGGVTASVQGSGDIVVDEVNGPSKGSVQGSGDVKFLGGRADPFEASVAGSGDVKFNGTAVNPKVRVTGSGDIDIADYEGEISKSGKGDVTIAGKRIK